MKDGGSGALKPRMSACAIVAVVLGAAACSRCASRPAPGGGESASPSLVSGASPRPARGVFVVHVVDVGTGLAVFIEGADFAMLYDGGSNDDLRDERSNRLTAYLRAARPELRALDHVVLSHAHRDHVEFLADVVNDYAVSEVWEPGVPAKPCAYQRFVHAIAAHPATKYHTAAQPPGTRQVDFPKTSCRLPPEVTLTFAATILEGTSVRLGEAASMTFLHVDHERRANINENSMVLRLSLGDKRVLLMGDAEAGKRDAPEAGPAPESVEGRLLARHATDLRSDVLVVGHHGSKTSTRRPFLDAVSPGLSVISGGPHPYDGHTLPDPEVVDLLTKRGRVMRTDLDDVACATSPAKIGRDADGRAGGCDNIRITLRAGEEVRGEYWRGHD